MFCLSIVSSELIGSSSPLTNITSTLVPVSVSIKFVCRDLNSNSFFFPIIFGDVWLFEYTLLSRSIKYSGPIESSIHVST